jgi:ABC-2 type transport system permease protein
MSARAPWLVIAKREFIERVRTKWFVIGTLLGPVLMLALILVPALLAGAGADQNKVAIVDRSGAVSGADSISGKLQSAFEQQKWRVTMVPAETTEQQLLAQVAEEKINSFLVVPADPLGAGVFSYQGDNASSQEVLRVLNGAIASVVVLERGTKLKIAQAELLALISPPRIETRLSTGQADGSSGAAAFVIGYAIMFLLYMAIILYGVNVMRSVVEEKTSRVVELMVAAAKPRDLMAGKILGVGAVGIVQMTVWLSMALLTLKYRDALLGIFGASSGGAVLPTLAISQIAVVMLYFLLGYFFYAALFAAVGAMVSSDQEAQQAQMPVTMALMIPITCVSLVANSPRGMMAQIMTTVPFSSPILMPMRYLLGGATLLQLAVSAAILAISTFIVVKLAAKIYRVGILMHGKRPSLRELARWLRY